MPKQNVLRVGVYNNFNFTKEEIRQVDAIATAEGYLPFVNSNSFVTISSEFPSIITTNPYLTGFVEPVGDLSNLKACRVKVVINPINRDITEAQLKAVDWCVRHSVPALLTFMRFRSKQSMLRFVSANNAGAVSTDIYKFSGGWYRPTVAARTQVIDSLIRRYEDKDVAHTYIKVCDMAGTGCVDCGNCARLTYGLESATVSSLSLSASGDAGRCLFNCPDCWAKQLSKYRNIKLDVVTRNSKQKGEVNHE